MDNLLTPAEAAQLLGVQPRTIRRMAETYEAIFGELPRKCAGKKGSPRLWTQEAVHRVQTAHIAQKSGKVVSLELALEMLKVDHVLPTQPETAQVSRQELTNILAQLAELRTLVEAQEHELACLRKLTEERAQKMATTPLAQGYIEEQKQTHPVKQHADPDIAIKPQQKSILRNLITTLVGQK
jgi:DNA-binding transcriptional MerR regulator